MDPTTLVMEWAYFVASAPSLALRGALGLALLPACAVVLAALMPSSEQPTVAPAGRAGNTVTWPAPADPPDVGRVPGLTRGGRVRGG